MLSRIRDLHYEKELLASLVRFKIKKISNHDEEREEI
jgi:hypothetical protein